MSSPDSYGYGGGSRDSMFEDRLQVFADTFELQVRKFSAQASVSVELNPSDDELSFFASVDVSLPGVVLKGCLEIETVVGSGEYSLKVFSKSCGKVKLSGFNFKLAVQVAALVKAKL